MHKDMQYLVPSSSATGLLYNTIYWPVVLMPELSSFLLSILTLRCGDEGGAITSLLPSEGSILLISFPTHQIQSLQPGIQRQLTGNSKHKVFE